jgi:hypothetical protein
MKFPFEVPFAEVEADLDSYVSAVISSLESDFLVLPRGAGFIDFAVFEEGYEFLKRATSGFRQIESDKVLRAAIEKPICFLVIRSMLGFTPPEWAHIASSRTGVAVSQGHIRTLDRRLRMDPLRTLKADGESGRRLKALINAACDLLREGAPEVAADKLHRLERWTRAVAVRGFQHSRTQAFRTQCSFTRDSSAAPSPVIAIRLASSSEMLWNPPSKRP